MFGWNNYDISACSCFVPLVSIRFTFGMFSGEGPDENLAGTGMELNEAGEGVSEQFIGDPSQSPPPRSFITSTNFSIH